MNCSPNYTEWSREKKEEYAKQRMDEMRLKNEKLKQRYAEVENDRIDAESRNSAVTTAAKAIKKDKESKAVSVEGNKEEAKVLSQYVRDWDIGKSDVDHWSPSRTTSSFKNYGSGRTRRDTEIKHNRGGFHRNENVDRHGTDDSHRKDYWTSGYSRNDTDHYRSDHAPDERKLRGSYRHDNNHHTSSRPQISPKRTRGVGYRDSHRKPHNSYLMTDHNISSSRKKHSHRAHSRSSSGSEKQYTIRAHNLWENDIISEDLTKQNRVEKWVKSVNKTNMWGNKQYSPNPKTFAHEVKAKITKFERYETTKRSPQYSSGSSTKNENYRKQRRFNSKGQKDDSWKDSSLDRTKNKTSPGSKLEDDCNTDQSHIKWKISNKEADVQAERGSDMKDNWNDNEVSDTAKTSMPKRQNEDDGIWSNVQQQWTESGNQNWECNNSSSSIQTLAVIEAKKDTESGDKTIIEDKKDTLERRDKTIIEAKKDTVERRDKTSSGPNEVNISECHSNSATGQQDSNVQESYCYEDTIVNSFKRSVCISDEKSISISIKYSDKPIASDDGGWSTVSEEVHSDDANKNCN